MGSTVTIINRIVVINKEKSCLCALFGQFRENLKVLDKLFRIIHLAESEKAVYNL